MVSIAGQCLAKGTKDSGTLHAHVAVACRVLTFVFFFLSALSFLIPAPCRNLPSVRRPGLRRPVADNLLGLGTTSDVAFSLYRAGRGRVEALASAGRLKIAQRRFMMNILTQHQKSTRENSNYTIRGEHEVQRRMLFVKIEDLVLCMISVDTMCQHAKRVGSVYHSGFEYNWGGGSVRRAPHSTSGQSPSTPFHFLL
jgi:hypothetical protein